MAASVSVTTPETPPTDEVQRQCSDAGDARFATEYEVQMDGSTVSELLRRRDLTGVAVPKLSPPGAGHVPGVDEREHVPQQPVGHPAGVDQLLVEESGHESHERPGRLVRVVHGGRAEVLSSRRDCGPE